MSSRVEVVQLVLFAWLLTLHDSAADRIYVAYGGVNIAVALGIVMGGGLNPFNDQT